jgi:hypothetical protein
VKSLHVVHQSCLVYLFYGCILYSTVFVRCRMNQNKFICPSEVKCLFDFNFSLFNYSYRTCNLKGPYVGRVNTNISHMPTVFMIQSTNQKFMIHVTYTAVGKHNFRCVFLLSFNKQPLQLKINRKS